MLSSAELAVVLARPPGPHAPEGDPGMLDLSSTPARCFRCGWAGLPTCVDGDPLRECPRCEAAPLVDGLLAARGLRCPVGPRSGNPLYQPRRVMRGRSAAAWRRRGVADVSPLGVRSVEAVSRNAPCPCGSGRKFKKAAAPDGVSR